MKKNILLVEDDQFLQQLYQELLVQEGYGVTVSGEGNDAENKILSNKWDLVLLDIILPGKNGFDILDAVAKKMNRIPFPIVFLTNLDSNQDDKKKLERAQDYWIKSNMSPPEFTKRVNAIFKSS